MALAAISAAVMKTVFFMFLFAARSRLGSFLLFFGHKTLKTRRDNEINSRERRFYFDKANT